MIDEPMVSAFGIWDGNRGGPVDLMLPVRWARHLPDIEVGLDYSETFGWQASLHWEDAHVLRFGYYDGVDHMLRSENCELPTTAPEDEWSDIEQCWWASIRRAGRDVLIAETDFDIVEVIDSTPILVAPGRIEVGGFDVFWHCVAIEAYEAAWQRARSFFGIDA